MGRILLLLGVVLIGVGVYGVVSSFLAPVGNVGNVGQALDAAQYCNPDEKLAQENGASSYTPGVGYGSTVQYYCVDEQGNRRDITNEFNENLVGQVSGIMSIFSTPLKMEYLGLSGLGLALAIIGLIVSLRRNLTTSVTPIMVGGSGQVISTSGRVVRVNGQDVIATPEVARYIQQAQSMGQFANMNVQAPDSLEGGDLAAKLRQLDKAREANLISEDEYNRLRQQILDSMS